MKAKPKRKASIETRYYGPSKRLRLLIYPDATARLYFRRPVIRGLFTDVKHAWEFGGEFQQHIAENLAEMFEDAVESQARACMVIRVAVT